MICDKCLHADVCGEEGSFEEALTYCADFLGWIPVSERLPEEETDVLICNQNDEIELSRGSYSTEVENNFIWYTSGWRFGKVIAWMPLPKPYKEESEEEE